MISRLDRVVQVLVAVLAVLSVAIGLWALASPATFFTDVAPYQPYSRHLIHDIGAFEFGLGACLLLGVWMRDALLAVLAGNAAGWIAHFVSHVMDHSIGGHDTDPLLVGLAALVLTTLALGRWLIHRRPRPQAHARLTQERL